MAMFDVDYKIKEAPLYKVHGEYRPCVSYSLVAPIDEAIENMDIGRRGIMPKKGTPGFVVTPTLIDKTRVPKGGHTMKILALYPYNLKDGGPSKWDEIKEQVGEGNREVLAEYVKNMGKDNIVAHHVQSPLDIAGRNVNNTGGTCHGGSEGLPQRGEMRPVFGWASHRMPIKGLYLTGAGSHPGGSVNGASGRNAAWVVLSDEGKTIAEALS